MPGYREYRLVLNNNDKLLFYITLYFYRILVSHLCTFFRMTIHFTHAIYYTAMRHGYILIMRVWLNY